MELSSPLTALSGIGSRRAGLFEKLNIRTVHDLLAHLPFKYDDLRQPEEIAALGEGQEGLVCGRIMAAPRWVNRNGRRSMFTFEVADESGALRINMFNVAFLFERLHSGGEYYFHGRVKLFRGMRQMDNPAVFFDGKLPGILPKYRLTAGLSQKIVRDAVAGALDRLEQPRMFSDAFYAWAEIVDEKRAYALAHRPACQEDIEIAMRALIYQELLAFHMRLELLRGKEGSVCARSVPAGTLEAFLGKLSFQPTGDQRKAMEDILADMDGRTQPMNRLVQGDVGCGKTAVAFFAAFVCMEAGGQTAFMAPTEMLAGQHYVAAAALFGSRAALLTGSTPPAERARIFAGLQDGSISLLVGTHALLFAGEKFSRLWLAITDEQHRFGVTQRGILSGERQVHTLIMSATPIPRTLALILYGKADISEIRQLPPGREPIKTFLLGGRKRADMYAWLAEKLRSGAQAYVVCPLIEATEGMEGMRSVAEMASALQKVYPDIPVAQLHGRMPPAEKETVMGAFAQGKISVLVATTVIEVGIDVPGANIIIIENADRFGLAQLHQLRGRVGRGGGTAFCYLVSDGSGMERLAALKSSTDGFEIAKMDMKLRGMGSMTGSRQHGEGELRFAHLTEDMELVMETAHMLEHMREKLPEDYGCLRRAAQAYIAAQEDVIVLN